MCCRNICVQVCVPLSPACVSFECCQHFRSSFLFIPLANAFVASFQTCMTFDLVSGTQLTHARVRVQSYTLESVKFSIKTWVSVVVMIVRMEGRVCVYVCVCVHAMLGSFGHCQKRERGVI